MDSLSPDNNLYNYVTNPVLITYMALVDAIIPRTPELAEIYGRIQFFGALDFYTDEFLYQMLNSFPVSLAEPTAIMLNMAANQLAFINSWNAGIEYPEGNTFASINPVDRFRTMSFLEELNLDPAELPEPYQNNMGLTLSIALSLVGYTMLGYYSEWFGYGTTRLLSPNDRRLEFYPISWEQVGYPGPSLGYRAIRNPNLFLTGGES